MTIAALMLAILPAQAPITIPFRISQNAMIVDAVVNGKKASFMFDTGFSGELVMTDAINVGPATGTVNIKDFVGTFTARTVKLRSLSMGGRDVPIDADADIIQQPMAHLSLGYNTHVDGIMGYRVVRPFVTEIDFQNRRMVLHPKTYDITQRQPDGKRTFLQRMLPTGTNSIEMHAVTATGKRMVLSLDTGNAFYATTHKDVLERVGMWEPGRKPRYVGLSAVASGPVESFHVRLRDLRIFGVPVEDSVWNVIDLPASSADGDGTVGFGFLRNFNLVIDHDRRRVWMENWTGKVADEPLGETGIYGTYNERTGRVEVARVSEESPGALAGVRKGDQILAVDGKDLIRANFRDVDRLMEGPVGSKVSLSLSRAGVLMRVEVERKALVNE